MNELFSASLGEKFTCRIQHIINNNHIYLYIYTSYITFCLLTTMYSQFFKKKKKEKETSLILFEIK
jgi:hypothetical protein